jgi:hypothetical protein
MPVDRYVAREASINTGTLRTKNLTLKGKAMTVNANVVGEMRIRLVDGSGSSVDGFDWVNLEGDDIAHVVNWQSDLESLGDKSVRIEFQLKNAQLFGFTIN